MTKKDIIERLMLDVECLLADIIDEQGYGLTESQQKVSDFLVLLREAGYTSYPDYNKQTEAQKARIQELLKMKPL